MSKMDLKKEAYHPDSHGALIFLWTALGLGAVEPTQEHIDWAKSVTDKLRQR